MDFSPVMDGATSLNTMPCTFLGREIDRIRMETLWAVLEVACGFFLSIA